MEIKKYNIEGLVSFTPPVFKDDRGSFFESFNQAKFDEMIGTHIEFVQDNQSFSKKDVVRGLHFQAPPHAQGKLVRVTQGRVIDVAVDIRNDSSTYGKYVAIELSAENGIQFWIPEGFAHGFSVLEDDTVFNYKCTRYYNKPSEGCIIWNDPDLNIDWGVSNVELSEKDKVGDLFNEFVSPF